MQTNPRALNTPYPSRGQILGASLIGTTIEFFDFYIYATASVLVFPRLFFPRSDPAAATLASLLTFGLAFFARPVGALVFGHFGDRVGRKATLVLALSTMGVSTVVIGLLPTYGAIGLAAPVLLALCRCGQGIGLGGEWGGAILLAVENAPPGRRAWWGMVPQFGAPVGFFLSGTTFLLLSRGLSAQQFLSFGWRLPFLGSAVLVLLGLYIRLKLVETPAFRAASARGERASSPLLTVLRHHCGPLAAGVLASLATFVLFYLITVFALSWGTTALGFSRSAFLGIQLVCVLVMALALPLSAVLAQRRRRAAMVWITVAIGVYGLLLAPLFGAGLVGVLAVMTLGMGLMGLSYGPLGTVLSELFPTSVRYTGASLAFSLGGVFGASLAPAIATTLARQFGLPAVGCYLTGASLLTLVGLALIPGKGQGSALDPLGLAAPDPQ